MTGRYLLPFCKKLFPCLPTLAPFVNLSVDTLAKGKASHALLLRRFAPGKAVRLLPDKQGQLMISILSFLLTLTPSDS